MRISINKYKHKYYTLSATGLMLDSGEIVDVHLQLSHPDTYTVILTRDGVSGTVHDRDIFICWLNVIKSEFVRSAIFFPENRKKALSQNEIDEIMAKLTNTNSTK